VALRRAALFSRAAAERVVILPSGDLLALVIWRIVELQVAAPIGAVTIGRVDARVALVVYLLVAAAAAFVTASRNLSLPVLLAVIAALAVVATLLRSRVLALGGATRVSAAFIAVYIVTFFVVRALLGR
jgi:hypothetical protein